MVLTCSDNIEDKLKASNIITEYLQNILTKISFNNLLENNGLNNLTGGNNNMSDSETTQFGNGSLSSSFTTYVSWTSSPAIFGVVIAQTGLEVVLLLRVI
jgi:hypothetical protein